MRLLWIALIALLLAGCAVVPYPAEVYGPSVSVGVGVPVYAYPYPYYYGPRYYHGRHHSYRHWH